MIIYDIIKPLKDIVEQLDDARKDDSGDGRKDHG